MFNRFITQRSARRRVSTVAAIESLEDRVVLYATSGNAWVNPEVVTISFQPDGTNLGGVTSELNSSFDSNPLLAGVWKSEILRAAQVWAQATNINFVVVSDSGASMGSGSYIQGSPTVGDIRIGGFNFGGSTLAQAYHPPTDNNYSVSGDIQFNTGIAYNVGSGIDLFTVAVHEFGHALGLDHSTVTSSQMYSVYNGVKSGLTSDDMAGIRNIYSANASRSADSYDASGSNNSIGNYTNINNKLEKSTGDAVAEGGDITTSSDVDFYRLTLPRWTGSTMTVRVQTTGLSMLAPKLTIYAENQTTVLGTVTGVSGSTISLAISGVGNNDQFYYKVESASGTPFNTGAYALSVDLNGGSAPVVTMPYTLHFASTPYSTSGAQADTFGFETDAHVAPDTPAIAEAKSSGVSGTATAGTQITVYDNGKVFGTTTTTTAGTWYLHLDGMSSGIHVLTATATDDFGNSSSESASEMVFIRGRKRSGKN